MKKIIFLFIILIFAAFSFTNKSYSQKPDEELTKEEAQNLILQWQARVNELELTMKNLDGDIEKLKTEFTNIKKQIEECNQSLYSLIGVKPADVENFKQQLGVIEGRIRDMKKLPDDVLADKQDDVKALENDLNALRANKICALPEIYNKVLDLARQIKGLYREKVIKSYTVGTWAENRDCLWNIAGKIEIYGDPFQWPKIWQSNTNIIRNPDIIHHGDVLVLPKAAPKTPEEIKAERKYWRNKIEKEKPSEDTQKK
jgi:nucleoid-associated protein YgaU